MKRFEEVCVAHLDAAYNLARWLTRDARHAEDVVQEACLRAFRFMDSYDGRNARTWLLAIVRNTYYTWREKNRVSDSSVEFDEDALAALGYDMHSLGHDPDDSIDRALQEEESRRRIESALAQLPPEFREVLVLRELEGLSYKEIAVIIKAPIGTVMSRLSRARKLLLLELQATRAS